MPSKRIIEYYLLVAANPLSDSKASIAVFNTISRLDLLSRDVTVFLPGFHTNDTTDKDSEEILKSNIDELERLNKKEYEDFHGKDSVYHLYCETVGDMYFNDADFSHFILDLEDNCPHYEYLGRAQLLVLPSNEGVVLFDKVKSYNLEPFFDDRSEVNASLEEFLMSTLKLIQKDAQKNSIELLEKISQLYDNLSHRRAKVSESEVIIQLDNQILKHMKWKDAEEIFFISYSTKDEYDAFALKALLEKYGKHVWIAPDGIPAGFDYACVIPAALRLTSRFVVLLSHNSVKSEWVRREVGRAISNKTIIDGIFVGGFSINELKTCDDFGFLFENIQLRYSIRDLFENKELLNEFINT